MQINRDLALKNCNPLSYFETFFRINQIPELLEDFYHNASKVPVIRNGIRLISTDHTNELVEFEEDHLTEVLGKQHLIVNKFKKEFKNELIKLLYQEFWNAKEKIDEILGESLNSTYSKTKLQNWINKLEILKLCSTGKDYQKYYYCQCPLNSLIKYVYDKYESDCPAPTAMVKQILNGEAGLKFIVPEQLELSSSFFKEILTLSDKNGNELFSSTTNGKANLMLIAGGNLNRLTTVADFAWPKEASYYLLNQIRIYINPSFKIKELVACTFIKFRGTSVTVSAFSKGCANFAQHPSQLKEKIDRLIERHLGLL